MSLLSLPFFVLSLAAAVWMWSAKGRIRAAGFAALSGWFVWSYLGWGGLAITLGFALAGYGIARLSVGRPRAGAISITLFTVLFVWMKGYSFLPDAIVVRLFATAGLSFLFFKILHVVVDHAGGTIERLRLSTYLLYCVNFTAFLMGPIQRYQDFEEQWEGRRTPIPATFEAHLDAVNRVLRGLVKKFVIAAYLADHAILPDGVFPGGASLGEFSTAQVLVKTYVFYLYLYFDFSGYCDVVIGVGGLIGVRPPENFRLPFFSPNISQYWLRVHRSLTTWLTDYLFNPIFAGLLRSKRFRGKTVTAMSIAMMTTMFVAGVWHGPTSNFALFGLVHGLFLTGFRVYEHLMIRRFGRKGLRRIRAHPASVLLGTVLTFALSGFAYLFFVLRTDQLAELAGRFLG